jgi:peptidoglycan/LPS O-acetylase OafA/YrhL
LVEQLRLSTVRRCVSRILGHCQALSGLPTSFVAGSNIASVGVYILLTISGYLVTEDWLKQPSLPFFMLKKAIRIFPVLAVAVLLTTFALGLLITGAEQIIKAHVPALALAHAPVYRWCL